MKAAHLRQSILQAAMQGRLAPQNPHDEPADKLLESIRAEKTRLVKEGKIKKEKPLPPITDDQMPYDLPDGWVWCRIAEVCIVNPRNQISDDIDVAFTPMTLISSEYFVGHKQEVRKWGDVKGGFTHYAENDVVVAKITPCFQNGKSCIMRNLTNGFGAGTTELHVLRCFETLPEYLLIYVKNPSFLIDGEKNMTGTAGQQRVPTDYLKSCLFPLPPLAEQQRIVAKVEELMALCDELEAAEKELDKLEANFAEYLPKSILQAAVQGKLVPQNVHDEPASELLKRIQQEKARLVKEGKIKKEKPLLPIAEDEVPYDLPDGWVWCRLGDCVQLINGDRGKNYPSKDKLSATGIPFISAINIEGSTISNDKLLCVSQEQYDILGSGKLKKDDIVFCIRGSLGKCGIYPFRQGAIASSLVILRRHLSDASFLGYLFKYITSPLLFNEIKRFDNGTAQPNLSAESLKNFLFPLPPLAEQQRIVAKVDELMALCDELKAARDISFTPAASNIIQFTAQEDEETELGIAARGDGESLPQEALDDLNQLWGSNK